ncbi:DGAT1/2-independent enzyme synthesizing storage lipids isoform X5 [Globicephala melas]|uniref:DGAT1/2-independent enzyme synthesizing storage lipids isoform X5 n=1 Tax=Globicephala melas TaxID=9731 RepID=UPI00293D7A94|nr:monoacylglycerol/Diacylglycerol O-acyltransferase isoform X5 [Globicephala melas]
MIDKNQTCGTGQDSMPSMTCLIHVLEEWFGVEQLEDYWNFANYLLWVFTPLILLILPYFTIFLLYLTIIFLHIYKRKNVLKEAYSHNLWDGARKTVATLWDGHAAVWHGKDSWVRLLSSNEALPVTAGGPWTGYEVHGMEKIPEGPALIIFYHGAIPIDFYYFMAKIFIHKGRTCRVVADHFVFKIPGLSLVAASGGQSSSRCAGLSLSQPLLLRSTSSRRAGSVVVAHGHSCSAACGIFPDWGSNPCPLHWQADSQPLRHQGSPILLHF